ncbi:hypothetical protein [Pantoea sp. DY-15]|uniref:hypothetical protein n=1 Tax=Pantoea sp. DY-15 TaxID=2871489 RepID=UPI00351D12AA
MLDHLQVDDCYFALNNVRFPLTQTLVKRNSARDYAVITPTLEIFLHPKDFIYFTDEKHKDLEPTSSMIIAGYPSSKNGLHADKPDSVQHVVSLLFNHFEYDKETEELYFHFDSRKKMVIPSMFEPLSFAQSLPYLNGMSGAPVLQIMQNVNTDALTLRVVGIFKEHHRKKRRCSLQAHSANSHPNSLHSVHEYSSAHYRLPLKRNVKDLTHAHHYYRADWCICRTFSCPFQGQRLPCKGCH